MRRIVALSVIFLFIVCVPGIAGALTINFDEFGPASTSFLQTTALRDEYAQKPYNYGVHFSGPNVKDGGAILDIATFASIKPLSGKNALAFNGQKEAVLSDGGLPVWPETIIFDTLWANVAIYVASARTDKDHFSLLAFDASGKQVAISEVDTKNEWALLKVTWAGGIKSVSLSMDKKGNDAFVADNLELTTTVPEPGSMLLLALGLIGIGVLRKRN
jgi:hypothetical protein